MIIVARDYVTQIQNVRFVDLICVEIATELKFLRQFFRFLIITDKNPFHFSPVNADCYFLEKIMLKNKIFVI